MKVELKDIRVYPTAEIICGEITVKQYLEQLSEQLMNDFYYGRRFDPENLEKLFNYTIQRLNEHHYGKKGK